MDNSQAANTKTLTRLMFRLLPAQVLLMTVGTVNGIISSFFATNYVGVDAMTAVGLYGPVTQLINALSTMLVGGAAILCGKYMGQNRPGKMTNIFSLDLVLSFFVSAVFIAALLFLSLTDRTGFFTRDDVVRPLFNRYVLGQTIGIIPFMLGSQLQTFLFVENRGKRSVYASVIYIIVNLILNIMFVKELKMEAFGLSLASSLGMWIFFLIEAQYFFTGRSQLRFRIKDLSWKDGSDIIATGFPGAATNGYQTIRGFIVNHLITVFIGSAGISAFAAANNLLAIFWAIPAGMIAVSRMLISVSIGEEDRRTLTDIMRVMFRRFVPLMCMASALAIILAVPLTRLFFHDPDEPVFMMTVWGFRIIPLCMPLAVIDMHFTCYGQASGKQILVQLITLMDGVICVSVFSALLIGTYGMNSVYISNVLNGIVVTLIFFIYSCIKNGHIPRSMDELMVIPDDFGVPEEDRLDLSVDSIDGVVTISQRVQDFCLAHGVDDRRSYLAGLSMEEMAGNIVSHGFTKDDRKHCADVRVVLKDDVIILRLKDDCVPFDPAERLEMAGTVESPKSFSIRMVYRIAEDVQYQNILGLNVLTIRI